MQRDLWQLRLSEVHVVDLAYSLNHQYVSRAQRSAAIAASAGIIKCSLVSTFGFSTYLAVSRLLHPVCRRADEATDVWMTWHGGVW